eukprot:4087857-Pleurochrysis_carterae.AAC.1
MQRTSGCGLPLLRRRGCPSLLRPTASSADFVHDNAFVQYVNDRFITPYVQSIGEFYTHYVRSDGCSSQF